MEPLEPQDSAEQPAEIEKNDGSSVPGPQNRPLSSPLFKTLKFVAAPFVAVFRFLFGSFQWSPPRWPSGLWRLLAGGACALSGFLFASRNRALAVLLTVAVALTSAVFYKYWYMSEPANGMAKRPDPVKIQPVTIAITDYLNDGSPNPMKVDFPVSVAPLNAVGKAVEKGISISPALAGKWQWTSDRQLVFAPAQDWLPGQKYQVKIDASVIAPQVKLASSGFEFSTPEFKVNAPTSEFYQDPVDPNRKQALVHLSFSHPVDSASLEKKLSMKFMANRKASPVDALKVGKDGKPLQWTIHYGKKNLSADIFSENLPIPDDGGTVSLAVEKSVGSTLGGTPSINEYSVPVSIDGLYSLTFNGSEQSVADAPDGESDQILTLSFSQSVFEKGTREAVRAWLLPEKAIKKKTAKDGNGENNDGAAGEGSGEGLYDWPLEQVTAEVLKASSPLKIDLVEGEVEQAKAQHFKFRADPGRRVYVEVAASIKSFGGYRMQNPVKEVIAVAPLPAKLQIMSQGALLPLSGDRRIGIMTRNVPGIAVEIGRILPDQLQHLAALTRHEAYASPKFYNDTISLDSLSERFEKEILFKDAVRGKAHYEGLDLAQYLNSSGKEKRGIFVLKVRPPKPKNDKAAQSAANNDADESGVDHTGEGEGYDEGYVGSENGGDGGDGTSDLNDSRLVLVTDLGLLVKKTLDGSQDVFVQSIHSGKPVAGATVQVIGINGQPLLTRQTGSDGHVQFPGLAGYEREKKPALYLVQKDGDMSFLPLDRSDRRIDYSRFDIGGIDNTRKADTLYAYLFTDRGLYRPGDTAHIGSIVKAAAWGTNIQSIPLEYTIVDARGLTVKSGKLAAGQFGFDEIVFTTSESAPTGTYSANLFLPKEAKSERPAQLIGSTSFKVQEFQPDRMKIDVRLSQQSAKGWVHPKDLKGLVEVQNLFGTPAQNRRLEAELILSPGLTSFADYSDYNFHNPLVTTQSHTEKLAAANTDDNGRHEFDFNLKRFDRATYRLQFMARVFEAEGGRSVVSDTVALVSEMPYLVGIKSGDNLSYVTRGSKQEVSLIAIDPQTKKTAVDGLTLEWAETKYVSVLTRQDNGTYKYESRSKNVVLKKTPLSIPAGGMKLTLDSSTPGNYTYSIRDKDGLYLNWVSYSVAGQGNVTRSLERNAELQIALDKKAYAPGEEISISLRAPYAGAGLITVERDKVYAYQWFQSKTTASVQKIRLPKDFDGNGYINVQYIRDPSSNEIFMSPLSYGIAPFALDRGGRTNRLKLTAAPLVKPGQSLDIQLDAEQPTRAAVYAVDEGILQVARYKLPNPLDHFYRKRRLNVSSTQILDLILPEFKKLMEAAAPGGDGAGDLARHLNPFKRKRDKPVVYWSGIVDIPAGGKKFSYPLPEYFNGSVRVMAVAVNGERIGTVQASTQVRGDFVLSPNIPAVVAPGDEFEISVGVANNLSDSGKGVSINLALAASDYFEVIGQSTQALSIDAMHEGVALFRLKAKDKLGSAGLTFTATHGDKKTQLSSAVSVRPASPLYTVVRAGSFKDKIELPVERRLYPEYRRLRVGVSYLPLVAAEALATYLDNFDHLCTEQLLSRAIPMLVLAKNKDFADLIKPAATGKTVSGAGNPNRPGNIADLIAVLRTRQNAEGGFGRWEASVVADEFASVYAAHFLFDARERGITVPDDLLQNTTRYLQQLTASTTSGSHTLERLRVRAYAAYLLTRQGQVTTPVLAALREKMRNDFGEKWKDDSAAVYLAASYRLLKQEPVAQELLRAPLAAFTQAGQESQAQSRSWYFDGAYYDPLVRDATLLYLLAQHFPERLASVPPAALNRMMSAISENRFNTLSAALTVRAFDSYVEGLKDKPYFGRPTGAEVDGAGKIKPLALPETLLAYAAFSADAVKLRIGAQGNAFYSVSETGFDTRPPVEALKNGLEIIIREYVGKDGKPLAKIRLGDEVIVRLRYRAIDQSADNVAFVDLLPGGFEPVLDTAAPAPAPDTAGNGVASAQPPARLLGWNGDYVDIREDRVVLYGTANANMGEFSYRIRATNAGTYVVPPAYAESLYQRKLQAHSAAGRIVVERAQ